MPINIGKLSRSTIATLLQVCMGMSLLFSQEMMYPFEHYNANHGLLAPVRKIIQDEYGFLWLGSSDGLSRFDGKSFKVFRNIIGDQGSIPNNIINDLALDPQNRIWVTTNSGLCYFSYEDHVFHQIEIPTELEKSDPYRIYCIANDKYGSNWFATKTSVHQLNQDFKIISSYKISHEKGFIIKAIYFDSLDHLFVGTNVSKLYMVDLCTGKMIDNEVRSTESSKYKFTTTVHPILPYKQDTLILGSWFSGLNKAFYSNGKLIIHSIPNQLESCLQKNIVTSIAIVSNTLWWVGTYGCGLALFNPSIGEYIRHIKFSSANPTGLSNNYINCIFLDKSDIIWIGTDDGLNKYDSRAHQFNTVEIPKQHDERSVYRKPSCILEDLDDSTHQYLFVAVPGIGLFHFNKRFHTMTFIESFPGYKGNVREDPIYTLQYNRNNELLIGMNSGIYHVDFKNRFCKPIQIPQNKKIKNVRKILQTKDGSYWVSSSGNGIYFFNLEKNIIKHFTHDPENPKTSLPDDHIFSLMEDYQSQIWIGTQNKGLCKINPETFQFQYFERNRANSSSLPDNGVFDLYEDEDHFIWIATENSLARMNPISNKLKIFTTAEGLINNVIYSITSDLNGRLWLATNSGISVLDPQQGSILNYSQFDGLASNRVDGATLSTIDGIMYFSSNGMISSCVPANMLKNTQVPTVTITSLKAYGQDIPLVRKNGLLKELHLSYRKNIFTVDFAALNFSNSSKNKYAYILEGYNNHWIYSGNVSTATYNNLSGGTYTFKVKAANNDGVWNTIGDQLNLVVHPPFWNTWWFYTLGIILIVSIFYLYYRIRINQLINLQQIRNSIARDLHDDVGSTLSSIHLASNMAEENAQKERSTFHKFQLIKTASKNAMEMMNEIVWSIQPENDRLERFISRMREYCSEILESAGISFQFEIDENINHLALPLEKRKDIFMIYKESINNLAKYSNAREATIEIQITKRFFQMRIGDNGIGFDMQKQFQGNGFRNMKVRANMLQSEFSITSSLGNGTEIILKVPLTT